MWDREAPTFDEAADHGLLDRATKDAWLALLLGHLPPAPARVADLGSGTGTLSVLLADEGYCVDGVDFAPEMVRRARAKAGDRTGVTFTEADAFDPPLPQATYDVVLSRHVLWAMPDPAVALTRWVGLLAPGGRLVLVEGSWSTGAGLRGDQTTALVRGTGRAAELVQLDDPRLWGRRIDDDRYLVLSPADDPAG